MSQARNLSMVWPHLQSQPKHVYEIDLAERDALVVSARKVDGQSSVLSRYCDSRWALIARTTNRKTELNFDLVPEPFRDATKEMMYRYLRCGRSGGKRPEANTACGFLTDCLPFLNHLNASRIAGLADVTPLVCATYAQVCKTHRIASGKPLAKTSLERRFSAVEALYELSQYTATPMPSHPWIETSSQHMAGLTGQRGVTQREVKTPLIPDEIFECLFQNAWGLVEGGPALLTLRDILESTSQAHTGQHCRAVIRAKNRDLQTNGWSKGLAAFNQELLDLRTACYIVVASVSGCRNHELALVQSDACYSTTGDARDDMADGEEPDTFWWMRSESTKTDEGKSAWQIPEAGMRALRVMDRWAQPYQAMIQAEIIQRRSASAQDPEIAEAQRHLKAVFVGLRSQRGQVRTLSYSGWRLSLSAFAKKRCALKWDLASHQFRRTFANYAARSQFGDLRYLKEHFKHWNMDMTLGYALNESQELALYLEIQDELDTIKAGLAGTWLNSGRRLRRQHHGLAWQRSSYDLQKSPPHGALAGG